MHWLSKQRILSDAKKKETAEKILETLDGLPLNDAHAILAFVNDSLGKYAMVNFLQVTKSDNTPPATCDFAGEFRDYEQSRRKVAYS